MQPPMKRVSGRLLEVLTIYSRALTEKSLVFMIGGRLWEVFASRGGRTWRFDCICKPAVLPDKAITR